MPSLIGSAGFGGVQWMSMDAEAAAFGAVLDSHEPVACDGHGSKCHAKEQQQQPTLMEKVNPEHQSMKQQSTSQGVKMPRPSSLKLLWMQPMPCCQQHGTIDLFCQANQHISDSLHRKNLLACNISIAIE